MKQQKTRFAMREAGLRYGVKQHDTVIWWRRGESNPRPQILRLRPYMLSLVFDLTFRNPTGRAFRNPTGRAANGGSGWF